MVPSLLLKIPQTGRRRLFKHPEIVVGFLKATHSHVSTMCCLPLKTKTLPLEIHTVPLEQSIQALRHKNLKEGEATSGTRRSQISNRAGGTLGILQRWQQTFLLQSSERVEQEHGRHPSASRDTPRDGRSRQPLVTAPLITSLQSQTDLSKVLKLLQA